jgi:ferric-dicitrate binding protein FerR (iron transport regulator)
MNRHSSGDDMDLLSEAREWNRKIADDDPAMLAAFAAWVKTSPRHLGAYLRHTILIEYWRKSRARRKNRK